MFSAIRRRATRVQRLCNVGTLRIHGLSSRVVTPHRSSRRRMAHRARARQNQPIARASARERTLRRTRHPRNSPEQRALFMITPQKRGRASSQIHGRRPGTSKARAQEGHDGYTVCGPWGHDPREPRDCCTRNAETRQNTQNDAHFNPPRRRIDAKSHEPSSDDSKHTVSRTRVEKSHKNRVVARVA